jgi:uncharacterized protein YaaN involved in tellurite resistance
MTTAEILLQAPEPLAAPETLTVVSRQSAGDMVPVEDARKEDLTRQADAYVDELLGMELGSEAFQTKMDAASALGRQSIAEASQITGRFMDKNFVGFENSPAFAAINGLRSVFEDLNPARAGDLLAPNKILGIIPFGNKLQAYFRKFDAAGDQIGRLLAELRGAEDEVRRDVAALGEMETRLWEVMGRLKEAGLFAEALDRRLVSEVAALKSSDPLKAEALEQEVLFYARQAHADLLAQQAVNVNAYRQVGVLKKTGRELINGCDRMATTGLSALATAQAVARATGTQIKVMEMLQAGSGAIGDLIEQTSVMLGKHVQQTGEMAASPVVEVDKLKAAFENTTRAMDDLDRFRSQALDAMARNNTMLKTLIGEAEQDIEARRGVAAQGAGGHDVPR